jgi:hypothetical protein
VFKKFLLLSLLLGPTALFAQVAPSASGGGSSIWVGGEFSDFRNDYYGRDVGPTIFVDYNLHPKWGAEGEMRWLNWSSDGASTEKVSNYLLGPRYRIFRYHQLSVWGKFLMGAGLQTYVSASQEFAEPIGNGSYFAYVPGVSAEYQITHRISARGGYEYQFWPSAPGSEFVPIGEKSHGLNPSGFSIGFTYRLFGAR